MIFNPTLKAFLLKEFRQVLRDPRMRILLFVAPAIQLTLFGVALSNDVKNIRLAVASPGDDELLQRVERKALGSGWFIPSRARDEEPFEMIQRDLADAVLVAPPGGLTRSFERGEGNVQLLVNASNVMKAQAVETYLRSILAVAATEQARGDLPAPPIRFDMRILYNDSMRTAVFLIPGVMGLVLCLVTIILTAMSISKEKEEGTFEMLIASPATAREVILGKTLPYCLLGFIDVPIILAVAVYGFDVPMRGSLLSLAAASAVFVMVAVSLGTLISTITRTQQQSMMGGFLFLFPAILLSGLMFPLENMPEALKIVGAVNPLAYFLELLRNIMLKGGDARLVAVNLSVLTVMGVALIFLSFRRFKTHLQQ